MSSESKSFADLGLAPAFVRAVTDEGYERPTPIQFQSIPVVLEGRDLLGCAQTGTGKSAAFLLPLLQRLEAMPKDGKVRALVLAPTRELAIQLGERAAAYGRFTKAKHVVVFGGVGQRDQEVALRARPDLVIATPGRLIDLLGQKIASLDGVKILVLDEADRMLDMGFIRDVRRILSYVPTKRQTLLFSATIPKDIAELVRDVLVDPARVAVRPEVTTSDRVEQVVHKVQKSEKLARLVDLLRADDASRVLVFTRTKHGANRLVQQLEKVGITALAIHGNKSQSARTRALDGFRDGGIGVLVATDIAARGIDVDGVSHVVNYELPNVPEQYVHRIGRTGRAGARGRAISLVSEDERTFLADIEKFIRRKIDVVASPPSPPGPPVPREIERHDPRNASHPGQARRAPSRGHAPRNAPPRGDAPRNAPPRGDGPRNAPPRGDGSGTPRPSRRRRRRSR
ncbi:MAG: DEAD/DEAH box helicase [Polyangiaceae bacterium]